MATMEKRLDDGKYGFGKKYLDKFYIQESHLNSDGFQGFFAQFPGNAVQAQCIPFSV